MACCTIRLVEHVSAIAEEKKLDEGYLGRNGECSTRRVRVLKACGSYWVLKEWKLTVFYCYTHSRVIKMTFWSKNIVWCGVGGFITTKCNQFSWELGQFFQLLESCPGAQLKRRIVIFFVQQYIHIPYMRWNDTTVIVQIIASIFVWMKEKSRRFWACLVLQITVPIVPVLTSAETNLTYMSIFCCVQKENKINRGT